MSAYERGFEAGKREAGYAKNKTITGLAKNLQSLTQRTEVLTQLLEIAACPCCDGSGAYYDGMGEVCQCQWCDEKSKALPPPEGE